MSRAQHAAECAAAWIIRRENGDWTDADEARLDAWLAQSDGNKAAYWRLRRSWAEVDRIRSVGRAADLSPPAARVNTWWKRAAVAASLAAIVALGLFEARGPVDAKRDPVVSHGTAAGEHETVTLADGSTVELNTRTTLRASVSPSRREIWLDDGEAFFEVARDPKHPFVVHAGAKSVTVLGTKFSVRRTGGSVVVSVLEGRVRIDDARASKPHSATIGGGVIAISRGGSMLVTQPSPERVENALAWRDGLLHFDQTSLADVALEFNRYHARQIVVTDPEAAAIRIGGAFEVDNVDGFLRLLSDAYGLKVVNEAGVIKISA